MEAAHTTPGTACTSYRGQGPEAALSSPLTHPLMELQGSGGCPPPRHRTPYEACALAAPFLPLLSLGACLEDSGTFLPLDFQLQTPGEASPRGVWFAGGRLSSLLC